jgi:tRNA(Ile)-lysidine synthase
LLMANSRKPVPQPDTLDDALAGAFADASAENGAIAIAFSGGLDSSVLLHAAAKLASAKGLSLQAVHINHGLSANADTWAMSCERFCGELGVPFFCYRVTLEKRASLEASARQARYAALIAHCRAKGCSALVTAHHADDQAETVLLNVLRGSGIRGMRGIASKTTIDGAVVIRPFIALPRETLRNYAKTNTLAVVDDESNLDRRFTRNALRHDVLPALQRIAPTTVERLAALARHARSADLLLADLAQIDLETSLGPSNGLLVERLKILSLDRAANLLRYWLARQALAVPPERRLLAWIGQVRTASAGTTPTFILDEHRLVVVAGELFMTTRDAMPPVGRVEYKWQHEPYIDVPLWGGRLWIEKTESPGIAEERLLTEPLSCRPRVGGERLQLHPARPSRTLKNLYQETNIDVASRRWLPIVYCGQDLVYAAGIGMNLRACDELALGASRLAIRWQPFRSSAEADDS